VSGEQDLTKALHVNLHGKKIATIQVLQHFATLLRARGSRPG
jgi:hypothetical protein